MPAAVRLNQLATNLTRLKMLTAQAAAGRFVMVNIPAAAVEAVENGRVVSRHTAIVGKVDRPSPIVNSQDHRDQFPSVLDGAGEHHPEGPDPDHAEGSGLSRREYHIRIYDQQGQRTAAEQIDWTTDEATNYMFRQDPGDFNSLGVVKINFPSPDGVYMHDTPHKGLFNDEYRFDSSGCVRVQNIRELIDLAARRIRPAGTAGPIDAEFRDGERWTSAGDAGAALSGPTSPPGRRATASCNFRNDIYGLDGLEQFAAQAPRRPASEPFRRHGCSRLRQGVLLGAPSAYVLRRAGRRVPDAECAAAASASSFPADRNDSTDVPDRPSDGALRRDPASSPPRSPRADPEIADAIGKELGRQQHEIELIASENIVSRAVLEAQGSVMTNKYAEGYPGKRYYGGCEFVDIAETLAIERAKKLFGCAISPTSSPIPAAR